MSKQQNPAVTEVVGAPFKASFFFSFRASSFVDHFPIKNTFIEYDLTFFKIQGNSYYQICAVASELAH